MAEFVAQAQTTVLNMVNVVQKNVDFAHPDFQYAVLIIALCPTIWNIVARTEVCLFVLRGNFSRSRVFQLIQRKIFLWMF
jgi:hypothetical protein